MRRLSGLLGLLVLFVLMTGCRMGGIVVEEPLLRVASAEEPVKSDRAQPLTVWTYFDISKQVQSFEQAHPAVEVEVRQFSYEEAPSAYLQALSRNSGPDLLIMDNGMAGDFVGVQGLENLLEAPYQAAAYHEAIPANLRKLYTSMDGRRMISLPMQLPGAAMYYRADLFEAVGLPGSPEELGLYLEEPQNWIEAARRLKQNGVYLFQWDNDPIDIAGFQGNFLGDGLWFARNTESYRDAVEVGKAVRQEGLALQASIWTEEGEQALQTGRLAAVYMGRWAGGFLQLSAPQTEGLWRVARLPLGLYGWAGGSSIAVVSTSGNKEAAWSFAQGVTDLLTEKPAPDPFFRGEPLEAFFKESREQIAPQNPTPFDRELSELWITSIRLLLDADVDTRTQLNRIEAQADLLVGPRRARLLNYLDSR